MSTTISSRSFFIALFVATAMLFSLTLGIRFFVPHTTPWVWAATGNVSVSVQPTDHSSTSNTFHRGGTNIATTVFTLSDGGETDDTLTRVDFTVVAGTPAITQADFSEAGIYRETGGSATLFDGGIDTVVTTIPSSSINIGTATSISGMSHTIGSSTRYYIVLKLANSAVDQRAFKVNVGSGGIFVSTSAITTTALTGTATRIVDNSPVHIKKVLFVNPTTLDIVFSHALHPTNGVTTGAFTLTTGSIADNSALTAVALQSDQRTIRVTASGAAITVRPSDFITALTSGSNAIRDAAGNIQTTGQNLEVMMKPSSTVLISEVQISGATATDEFVELYNASGTELNLSGYRLAKVSSNGLTITSLVSDFGSHTIAARGFFLVARATDYTGSVAGNLTYTGDIGGNETVLLYSDQGTTVLDMVGMGTAQISEGAPIANPATNGSIERKAQASSTSATMTSGGADVSVGNSYDTSFNEWDFVQRTARDPQNKSSTTETPPPDTTPPGVGHMPIAKAVTNQDVTIHGGSGDNVTPPESLTIILDFKRPGGGVSMDEFNENPDITCTPIGGWGFRCVIPAAFVNDTNDVDYYIKSRDAAGNSATDPAGATPTGTVFYHIDVVASAGTRSIAGNVKDNANNNIAGASVRLQGTTIATVTDSTGNYTLSNVFDGCWGVEVDAPGFTFASRSGLCVSSTVTSLSGINFVLYPHTAGGSGGDSTPPTVMWTAPQDAMSMAPTNISWPNSPTWPPTAGNFPVLVKFSEPMDAATITASNIYLTTDGTTPLAGVTVTYVSAEQMAVLSSSTALAKGTQYAIVVIPAVTDVAHNPLAGNRPGGGFVVSFTTAIDTTGQTGGFVQPPFVTGAIPQQGAFDVPLNTKIQVTFSEAMDPTTVDVTNSTSGGIQLFHSPAPNTFNPMAITVSLDTVTKTIATITLVNPPALNGYDHYIIKVFPSVKSAKGVFAVGGGPENIVFRSEFVAGAASNTSPPTILGVNVEMFKDATGNVVNVPVNFGAIMAGFSLAPDPTTVNTSTIKLFVGTSSIAGTVSTDAMSKSIMFVPGQPLNVSTTYTFKIIGGASGVKALNAVALASDYTLSFTTSSTPDTTQPTVKFANGTDFALAVTFSEPMNSDDLGTPNYGVSVKNPANYQVKYGAAGTDLSTGGTVLSLTGKTIRYGAAHNTAILEGLGLPVGNDFRVVVSNVKDLSGNAINTSANTFVGPVMSPTGTGGMVGPSTGGMMTGPSGSGFDMGMMGIEPVGAFPMNMMAGQTTTYFVNIPVSVVIPAGGSIVLTFPSGFDVSGAAAASQSPVNSDINGPNTGVITIASVTADNIARTITVVTGGAATQSHDFLHFDISGIKNSPIAQDFNTSGYTVDIKTKDASGKLLESKTSMPFFLTPKGNFKITGTITASGTNVTGGSETMKLFVMSPMTGPSEISIAASSFAWGGVNSTVTYNIFNLNAGEYDIMTLPIFALAGVDFNGVMPPLHVSVNATNCSSNTCTQNITLTRADTGAPLTVRITGTFAGGGEGVDIFAGSWGGAGMGKGAMKTVTLTGSCAPCTQTIYLPALGDWSVGMGPAMPKTMMMFAPPPMPSWMPPPPVQVNVSGSLGSPTWKETSGAAANDGIIAFTVTGATSEIRGQVVDSAGTGLDNVEIFAHKTTGFGFAPHGRTDPSGNFVLKVENLSSGQEAVYSLGLWKKGFPPQPEMSVVVKANTGASDGNSTADVYVNGLLVTAANPFKIKLAVSSLTISGRVTDGTNPLSSIPITVFNSATGQNIFSMSDSTGQYIVYVTAGTWTVKGFSPEYGELTYPIGSVTITTASASNINLQPSVSTTNMATITGTVTLEGAVVRGAEIWAEPTGALVATAFLGGHATTETDGTYRLKVQAGTYVLRAWVQGYGELPTITNVTVTAGQTLAGQNFTVTAGDFATITIAFTNPIAGKKAFVGIFSPSAKQGAHIEIADINVNPTAAGTLKIKKANGFEAHAYVDGIGELRPDSPNNATFNITGNMTLTFTLPASGSRVTISGNVKDANNVNVQDAWIWAFNKTTGKGGGGATDSNGNYNFVVSQGTYDIGVNKPSYISPAPEKDVNLTTATTYTKNFVLTVSSLQIKGQLKKSDGTGVQGWVFAEKVTSTTDFTKTGGHADTVSDPSGNYELPVSAGFWMVCAVGEGYKETCYSISNVKTAVQVSTASVTGIDVTLTAIANFSAKPPKVTQVVPADGGVVDDSLSSGVKLIIPPTALGTGASPVSVNIKETTQVRKSEGKEPLAGKSPEITIVDSSGLPLPKLQAPITLEYTYKEADIPAGISENQLVLTTWDKTKGVMEEIPTVRDTTNNKLTGSLSHLSLTPPATPSGAITLATPATPTATAYQFGNGIQVNWSANTESGLAGYEVYRSTSATGTFSNISGDSEAGGTFDATKLVQTTCKTSGATCSYVDSSAQSSTTYYYKIAAFGTDGSKSAASAASGGASWQGGAQAAGAGGGAGGGGAAPAPAPVVEKKEEPKPVVQTREELIASIKAQIAELVKKLQELLAKQKKEVPAVPTPAPPAIEKAAPLAAFKRNLSVDTQGDDVRALQEFLAKDPVLYPEGRVTGFFGPLTKSAVIRFQEKYADEILKPFGLTKGNGFVGSKTRAKLQELMAQ